MEENPTTVIGTKPPTQIACRNLWKIFGDQADRLAASVKPSVSSETVLRDTGNVLAVRDVSFEVSPGETFVIMGLSGSGKSTLVRCLSRLIEPTQGEIRIDGEDLLGMDNRQLREVRRHKMSMVFQHFGNFPHKRVLDNVIYGLQIQGVDKETYLRRAEEVIELVGLTGWEDRYPGELSGGMQQRVGLARALAVNPKILLFDEPFSALDPLIRRDMQDELIKLQRAVHKTIVFITHDFLEALKLGDRVAIMKNGAFVQVGTPEEVVAAPTNDYVKDFTRDVPRSKVLTAQTAMEEPRLVVPMDQAPAQVLRSIAEFSCECAYVVDEHNKLKGVVLPEELSVAVAGGCLDLEPAIKNPFPTAFPDSKIEDLLPLCIANVAPIAVVDEEDHLLGAVSRLALMSALVTDPDSEV
jgi:glycine betaine/proline transport system ATP-binding protein